ncbi:MAG TPA: GNAT family N-acetyltransferase [Prolixibacteraceae bacterium]
MGLQQPFSETFSIMPMTDERWISFLNGNPRANIFHHPAWSQLLAECYGFTPAVCTLCDSKGIVLAGLPFMKVQSWMTGYRWISLPFTDHCMSVCDDTYKRSLLIDGLLSQSLAQGIDQVELRGEPHSHPAFRPTEEYLWHVLPLDQDFSKVTCRFKTGPQRNVKTALKRGVRVTWGKSPEDLKNFYQLHLETRRRQGVPVQPERFFQLIGQFLFNAGFGSILQAYKDGKVIAALILLNYGQTMTFKYGASDKVSLNLRPNDLLLWTAIQWGCQHGFRFFDMGRTDIDNAGLRSFKQGWGADELPLTYSATSPSKKTMATGHLADLMKPIIQRAPLWVCRAAGELLYKYAA